MKSLFGNNTTEYLEYLNDAFVPFASKKELANFSFETNKGIYVERSVTRVLGKKLEFLPKKGVTMAGYRLFLEARSTDFVSEFGDDGYAFTSKEGKELLKLTLATLVLRQKEGNSGILIEDGTENVFFFKENEESPCHEIEVFRDDESQDWYFHLAEPNQCLWREESRIFKFVKEKRRMRRKVL